MTSHRTAFALLTLVLAAGTAYGQGLPVGHELHRSSHPIMHFSRDFVMAHLARRAAMPKRQATPEQFEALQRTVPRDTLGLNLLPNINFNSCGGQTGWDQGQCGNCWVWGSTAACSIDAGVATGTPQLFSTQWFDSDYYATEQDQSVCDGGDSAMFANWYNSYPKFIPWTNTDAGYTDGNGPSSPATSASSIGQTPNVPVTSISASQIVTTGVSQAQAIANIKSVLDANPAVVMAFVLPSAGWTAFATAGATNRETTPWAGVDSYNGTTMDSGGGGHLVCVVGYDNTNNSWVVLNSWGPTSGRPDGYFEVPQAMGYGDTMDYDGTMNQYEFDTYEVTGWGGAVTTAPAITTQPSSQTVAVGQSGRFSVVASGSTPLSYQWYHNGAAVSGATSASYTTPVTTSANSGDTYYVTVSNGAGSATSSTATLTVTASTLTDLIVNGGFENGATGWTAAPGIIGQHGTQEPAYAGTWDAWFGGTSSRSWNTVAQTVAIPGSATSAALSFYLHIDTRRRGAKAEDEFVVQVRDSARLTTLATFSNVNAASGYQLHTFNLGAYAGQTVQVSFSCSRETNYTTSFVLDNVSLKVSD